MSINMYDTLIDLSIDQEFKLSSSIDLISTPSVRRSALRLEKAAYGMVISLLFDSSHFGALTTKKIPK